MLFLWNMTGAGAVNVEACVTTYRTRVDLYASPRRSEAGSKAGKVLPPAKKRGVVGQIRPGGYGCRVKLPRGVLGTLLERAINATDEWKLWRRTSFKRRRADSPTVGLVRRLIGGSQHLLATNNTQRTED